MVEVGSDSGRERRQCQLLSSACDGLAGGVRSRKKGKPADEDFRHSRVLLLVLPCSLRAPAGAADAGNHVRPEEEGVRCDVTTGRLSGNYRKRTVEVVKVKLRNCL
jgi:hypothetical protein